jgi:hypothetical protein
MYWKIGGNAVIPFFQHLRFVLSRFCAFATSWFRDRILHMLREPSAGERVMDKRVKKIYEKPRLRKVHLDSRCAVLGFCKVKGSFGPRGNKCGLPAHACSSEGS